MKNLLPGVLFATVGLALLDSISGIISTSATYIQSAINLKIAKNQVEINKLVEASSKDQEQTRVIGFCVDSEEEEDYYDD